MAYPKGRPNPNAGRPKGSVGAATLDARRAIADFVDGNAERLQGWLDRIAEDNPLAAFDRFMSVVEYHIPKLARTEITGKDGERLSVNVTTGLILSGVTDKTIEADYKEIPQPLIEKLPDEPS